VVLANNAIRAGFPTNDAGVDEVVRYYADHQTASAALAALFPVGLVGITAFAGSLVSRLARTGGRVPALVGALGVGGIIANFTMLTATDLGIAGYVDRGSGDASVVEGLWVGHNAIFGVLLASIGIALGGLALGSVKGGLLSRRWKVAAPVGAALLLAGAANTPAIVEGSPVAGLGFAGFAVWVAFVVTAALKLLRTGADA
jgi:hypothetical protein